MLHRKVGAVTAVAAGISLWGLTSFFRGHSEPCRQEHLTALTAEQIERVRRDPSATPEVYALCRDELADDLGRSFADLTEDDRRLIFCMVLAHSMAPYGPSEATSLPDLLSASHLHCGNYSFLMTHLRNFCTTQARSEMPELCLLGWEGGSIGNHAMAYRPHRHPGRSLFLDPTVGLLCQATFDEVASGQPVTPERIVCFGTPEDNPTRDDVERRDVTFKAFIRGQFRPSHLLYYFESMDHQLNRYGSPCDWPTPGAINWRRTYLTPDQLPRQAPSTGDND